MDWGNAIIRSKTIAPSGVVESIEADLHLEGDYRKTDKKVTWLADHSISLSLSLPLVDVTLLDYDYLITKKKLEEEDDVKDFVTSTTEFRVEALADNNVKDLKVGDIIQFERKGYYRVDAVRRDGTLHIDFIHIPDGKAAGLASKSIPVETPPPSKNKTTKKSHTEEKTRGDKIVLSNALSDIPLKKTAMYEVSPVYGDKPLKPLSDTKMYSIPSVYGDS
ncbi:hypothetical protein Clacol_006768 [Clathrus columnatus]|uniref:glutamate--tRNA ligase n=1 Tax=Clathrus columnatus TaxID=1419009 RepID=A0AAV5ADT6_9AGAM|nr:hypothetical protein Clacol_006768 [Clathrus columnatus]